MEKGISVVLLAYKEEENLRFLLPQIISNMDKIGEEYEILVIDTEKPLDNTKDVCYDNNAKYYNQEWPGFGGAFKTGIKYAEKEKFLILDSDGSHNPDKIPEINALFESESCDVVIGSRYTKGGKTSDSFSSIIMSKILNSVFRLCLGIRAKDISTDFRMYKTCQLKNIELENKNYDVLQEVLLKLKMHNTDMHIGEVPISFQKRVYGESKRQLLRFILDYIKSLFKLTCMRFPLLRNLILYGIFGVGGAVIEYVFFWLFTMNTIFAYPEISNVIAAIAGFTFTFTMNTFVNFQKRDKIFKRLLSYGSVCAMGILFSTLMIYILKPFLNLYFLKFILMVVVSIVQFMLNKYFTYK